VNAKKWKVKMSRSVVHILRTAAATGSERRIPDVENNKKYLNQYFTRTDRQRKNIRQKKLGKGYE
jgi:hypothetical protein